MGRFAGPTAATPTLSPTPKPVGAPRRPRRLWSVVKLGRPCRRPRRFGSSPFPRGVAVLARREREGEGGSSIRGNHANLRGPTTAELADGLGAVFSLSVPSGWILTMVLSIHAASIFTRTSCFRCSRSKNPIQRPVLRPAVHPGADAVPIAEARRQTPPFAAVFGHVKDGVDRPEAAGDQRYADLHERKAVCDGASSALSIGSVASDRP